jgi:hypothetical protein
LLGDGEMMNTEFKKYQEVTVKDINEMAVSILRPENSNTLWYLAEK